MVDSRESVEVEPGEGYTTVALNRPDKLNALNERLVADLHAVLSDLVADPPRGVLLTGRGRATCAGMDLDVVGDGDFPESYPDLGEKVVELPRLLGDLPCPVVMAAKGAVVGSGFGLAVESDFVVLGDETTFSYPEITYDITPPGRRVDRLRDAVGPRVAAEIFVLGEPLDPERALELGLVNRVVDESTVDDRAVELVGKVVDRDPGIVRAVLSRVDER